MLLAQYGANVIKVEPIETGDWSRTLGVVYGDHTAIRSRAISVNARSRST